MLGQPRTTQRRARKVASDAWMSKIPEGDPLWPYVCRRALSYIFAGIVLYLLYLWISR